MLRIPTDAKPVFRMQDMKPGQIGVIEEEGIYKGHIIYCFKHNEDNWCVSLNHKNSLWEHLNVNTLLVRLLKPGEILEVI